MQGGDVQEPECWELDQNNPQVFSTRKAGLGATEEDELDPEERERKPTAPAVNALKRVVGHEAEGRICGHHKR